MPWRALLIAVISSVAWGQAGEVKAEATHPRSFFERLQYTGLVDVFAGAHLEDLQPTQMRVFDTNGAGVGLSYAKVGLWFDADPIGFRVDLGFGQTMDVLSADTSIPVVRQFEQAYVSGRLPIHRGVTVDFGRFLTCAGNETVDSRQSWLYSRSLLFGSAAPFTHTGFRVTAPLTDGWTLLAGAVQGWDVIVDNNAGKSFILSSTFTPSKTQTFSVSLFAGPELATAPTWRFLVDGVWLGKLPNDFEVAANVDAAVEGATSWYGLALSAHYTWRWLDVGARGELFDDPQNARLHLVQASPGGAFAWEATLSARATLNQYLQVRAEYRHDQFSSAAASTPQDTLSLAVVAGI